MSANASDILSTDEGRFALSTHIDGVIGYVYLHPVTLDLVRKDISDVIFNDILQDFEKDSELSKYLKEFIKFNDGFKKYGWDHIPYDGLKLFTVCSYRTGNDDARGGGCGNLNIPLEDFKYTITSDDGKITIGDIVEAVYRMKGSKYDWWYELYSGINLHKDSTNDHVRIVVEFDYGS